MTVVRKIKNKERCAYRGPKARYAVWRAELNQEWERIYKLRCETICADNGLNIEDFKSSERRNTWEHTRDNLEAKGYRCLSKSWRDLQYEDEINCMPRPRLRGTFWYETRTVHCSQIH